MESRPPPPVTVITTLFNEESTVSHLLDSLNRQTVHPDEIIVAEARSTDHTRQLIENASRTNHRIRIVDAPGNRSAGRNAAISAARNELIACIDGGCVAQDDWLENLTTQFSDGAQFIGGFYEPLGTTNLSTCIGLVMVYVEEEAVSGDYLPSARSVAFHKDAWRAAGGFPQDTEFAEDTLFAQRIVEAGFGLVPALDARVWWTPPSTLGQLARTSYRWGHGDGSVGLRGYVYKRLALIYFGGVAAALALGLINPLLALLPILLIALDSARRLRFKIRHAPRPQGYLWLPIAHLVSTFSAISGFLIGWNQRKRRPRGG